MLPRHLQVDADKAVKWFDNNQTTAISDTFQSIVLSWQNGGTFDISVDGHTISRYNTMKCITLDDKLNFRADSQYKSNSFLPDKCIGANFLNEQCRMNVYKTFINANFNYCPIVWMFCGKTNLNKLENCMKEDLQLCMATTPLIMMLCCRGVISYALV